MPPAKTMTVRTKAILMNATALVALFYEYWKGTPLLPIVVAGILILVIINVLPMFVAKKQADPSD